MNPLNKLRWLAVAGFAGLLLLAALCDRPVAGWEPTAPKSLRAAGQVFTALGTSGYMFAVAAMVIVVAAVRLRREPLSSGKREGLRQQIRRAAYFFAVIAVSGLTAQILKHLIGRVRPHAGDADPLQFIPFSMKASFASFPSGHAASAFAAATALGLMFPRLRWPLVVVAVLIAVSRVVVGAHFPSDVVCGAALGVVTALALANYSVWQDWILGSLPRRFGRL